MQIFDLQLGLQAPICSICSHCVIRLQFYGFWRMSSQYSVEPHYYPIISKNELGCTMLKAMHLLVLDMLLKGPF